MPGSRHIRTSARSPKARDPRRPPARRTAHPLALDRVVGVANARGVEHRHGIAAQIEMDLQHVAGGSGKRRYDCRLPSRQPIEQRRLARIWRTRDGDAQPLAQPLPLPCQALLISSANGRIAPAHAPSDPPEHHPHRKNRSRLRPKPTLRSTAAASVSARSPSRPLSCRKACRRCASVSAATRSASPSTAVKSMRPFSKARRVNSPASAWRKPASFAQADKHRSDHGAAAMNLQLDDVLAGLAVWAGKPQRQAFVDQIAGRRIAHPRQRGPPRRRHTADQRLERRARTRSRNANDRDRRRRPAGRESEDGIAIARHV